MPEGEEEEQGTENLSEKIMKENFANLGNRHKVQEAWKAPNKLDPKRTTPRRIMIKMPKVKDKERILKVVREKQSYLQKSSHKTAKEFP